MSATGLDCEKHKEIKFHACRNLPVDFPARHPRKRVPLPCGAAVTAIAAALPS
jgi:hypothetical protein